MRCAVRHGGGCTAVSTRTPTSPTCSASGSGERGSSRPDGRVQWAHRCLPPRRAGARRRAWPVRRGDGAGGRAVRTCPGAPRASGRPPGLRHRRGRRMAVHHRTADGARHRPLGAAPGGGGRPRPPAGAPRRRGGGAAGRGRRTERSWLAAGEEGRGPGRCAGRVAAGIETPGDPHARRLPPVPQHVVRGAGGEFLARVDLAYPDLRVAVEYDGAWHAEDGQFVRDRRRPPSRPARTAPVRSWHWSTRRARSPAAGPWLPIPAWPRSPPRTAPTCGTAASSTT